MLPYLVFILFGFASGSVLYALLLPRLFLKKDVTTDSRDHNPGAANAFLHGGVGIGSLCLCCDLLKGILPVYFACRVLDPASPWFALVLVAPVLGHLYSPMAGFHGGKGIAVSFGVLLGLLKADGILLLLIGLYLFTSLVVVVRPHRLRTMATYALLGCGALFLCHETGVILGVVLMGAAIFLRHLPPEEGEERPSVGFFAWRRPAVPLPEEEEKPKAKRF